MIEFHYKYFPKTEKRPYEILDVQLGTRAVPIKLGEYPPSLMRALIRRAKRVLLEEIRIKFNRPYKNRNWTLPNGMDGCH